MTRLRLVVPLLILTAHALAAPRDAHPLDDWAAERVEEATRSLAKGDTTAAVAISAEALDTLIAWRPDLASSDALVPAFVASTLAYQTNAKKADADTAAWLATHPPVATAFMALYRPHYDDFAKAIDVIGDLIKASPEAVERFPELAAAVALVFDAGPAWPMIEFEVADPASPVEIFTHLANTAKPADMPGELLVYTVDAPVSTSDLAWAFNRNAGDRYVGRQFHLITYDHTALGQGDDNLRLRGGASSFSLPVVLEKGGVCRHQAFFAASVGKAIGVPTVYCRASGPSAGHAWVGYLRVDPRGATWDMSEGRFGFYEQVRGEVRCPQTRRSVGDQRVAMTAELLNTPLEDRARAAALVAAAERLVWVGHRKQSWPPARPEVPEAETPRRSRRGAEQLPREATVDNRFALLEAAVDVCPWKVRAWDRMLGWASEMSDATRDRWFRAIDSMVGARYPDVVVEFVSPMIRGVEDPNTRDDAWAWLAGRVRRHEQLAVEVAVERAKSLQEAKRLDAAWRLYNDTALRYANAGPTVLEALKGIDRLAQEYPEAANARLDAFHTIFARVQPADSTLAPAYRSWSTKARVGKLYAARLYEAGRSEDAARVLAACGLN